jgi:hypothetical protein
MEFSMEFHGIPWKISMGNSMKTSMENFTEFHGIFHKHLTDLSMIFSNGIPWKINKIPWISMKFNGIS